MYESRQHGYLFVRLFLYRRSLRLSAKQSANLLGRKRKIIDWDCMLVFVHLSATCLAD